MGKLVCDICRGKLLKKAGDKFVTCEKCGMQYTTEILQARLHDLTEMNGNARRVNNLDWMINNAETFISLGKIENARRIYSMVTNEYPADSRAWWGLFKLYIGTIENTKEWNLHDFIWQLEFAQTAMQLSQELGGEYRKIAKSLIQKVENGDVYLSCSNLDRRAYSSEDEILIIEKRLAMLPQDDVFRIYLMNGRKNAEVFSEYVKSLGIESFSSERKIKITREREKKLYNKLHIVDSFFEGYSSRYRPDMAFVTLSNIRFVLGRTIISALEDSFNVSLLLPQCYSWTSLKEKLPEIIEKCKEEVPDGGCYIATAVYGSYDCPQVWVLRRYRDYTLANIWYGRIFVRTYYITSPVLVKWFGHTGWFKRIWKSILDGMVEKLQTQGMASTPYRDRPW